MNHRQRGRICKELGRPANQDQAYKTIQWLVINVRFHHNDKRLKHAQSNE